MNHSEEVFSVLMSTERQQSAVWTNIIPLSCYIIIVLHTLYYIIFEILLKNMNMKDVYKLRAAELIMIIIFNNNGHY